MKRVFLLCLVLLYALTFDVQAQQTNSAPPANWFNLDPEADKVRGVSTERAYADLLKGKTPRTVIVAVIDGGVDTAHPELKPHLWTNTREIPGNGKDDDGNGYIDDVHGWNFLGGPKGNVQFETMELTRELLRLQNKYNLKNGGTIADPKEQAYYNRVKTEFENESKKATEEYNNFKGFYENYQVALGIAREVLKTDSLTEEKVKGMPAEDRRQMLAKQILMFAYQNKITEKDAVKMDKYYGTRFNYHFNLEYNPRGIVQDDPANGSQRNYGNADVTGPDADHGTHVAGIIAADRDNNIGIKGVAGPVQIMAIRAVPDGDERDKDVANAIRYAADNGAHIINMSFGKAYSPDKPVVDAAVKHAVSKGVLLVHAAGNESQNIDQKPKYPSRVYAKGGSAAGYWIEVGANSFSTVENFVAPFSNYGAKGVDVFAPGADIYSTAPHNQYEQQSGTSMAAPVVSGMAAVLMAYYPKLTAPQVKNIILKSALKYPDAKVLQPQADDEGASEQEGEKKQVVTTFGKLSVTGGIANLYQAVRMAEKTTRK
jgi:subtilisin family serine protease